ncbi:MAG TPA: AraC family transcriptional regulator [Macellibacteroides fermentans]|uniref:AraC family transcriptional regulator n=1 Tax=Macellibacteroides fermentans TaxID=879969 RepID=UPI002C713FDF|nr:AraC family transcriptional regulator [Macellibacteroides fermentans]
MNTNSLFTSLEEIVRNLEKKRLADVFRFVSFKPFEKFGPHQHVRIEINYVKKGNCILKLENESVCFSENEIMIVCSNVKHSFEAGAEGTILMQLEFLPEIFSKFDSSENSINVGLTPVTIFSEANHLIKIVNNVRIMRAVQRIVNELNTKSKYYQHLVVMYYAELLILIYRHMDEAYLPICTNDSLKKAISFLRMNFYTNITMEEVAQHAGIGVRYLRKLFSHHLNISPLDYLNQIRINKSIDLLKNTELSIKEVCFTCGFKSPQYFSRVFKQQMGISPKEILNR